MAYSFEVTVFRRNLQAEFQVGGQGYRWLDKVKLEMHTRATALSSNFVRSGEILRGHRSHIRGINQWACVATIENVAAHAEWKHQGTRSVITATDPDEEMWVPIAPMAWKRRWRSEVRGQKGYPWLDIACTSVAIGHGAVPYG